MRRGSAVLLFVVACHGGSTPPPAIDAPPSIDAAPYQCTPARVQPADACLALAPGTLAGATPFGNLDVALVYFGAGDCITISQATILLRGACGEELRVSFSYPVASDGTARSVTTSFDRMAGIDFSAPGIASQRHVAPVRVDVTRWQEGQGMHDIDIMVTVNDPAYSLPPLRVQGTFCDWPYQLC
jgi:hypothetical protein